MRLIDADKIHPDVLSKKGLCITQNQLANAPTIDAVPVSVINDIQEEIDDEWYRVKRESYERAEGLELASEIIEKHISGAKMEGEE